MRFGKLLLVKYLEGCRCVFVSTQHMNFFIYKLKRGRENGEGLKRQGGI